MRPKIKVYDPSVSYRFAHLKRDGIWITLSSGVEYPGDEWVALCHTRHPDPSHGDITDQLRAHPAVQDFRYRSEQHCGAILYCELYAPGQRASMVKSHLAHGRLDELRLECFATPDLDPDEHLEQVAIYARGLGVEFCPWWHCDNEHWRHEEDAEGLVFKDGNLLNWAKLKRVATLDAVVVDIKDGAGKYLGLPGALVCAVEGRVIASVSGMDDNMRAQIGLDWNGTIGRVVEIEYQYVGDGGRLRHPRFVRFRDDKAPDECLLSQDHDLEEHWP